MGCGGSKNEARAPGLDDDDLQVEISGTRVNKQGKKVDPYERDQKRPADNNEIAKLFEIESAGEGEQVMAVKPWIGALKAPSNPPQLQNSAPVINLELEYVYGYRIADTRQNLFYTSDSNKVVYMIAAIGVILDKHSNTQQFFGAGDVRSAKGHSDDITALAIHPNKDTIATGEVGANPKVCIWSASNPHAAPIATFNLGRGRRGVSCLGFSHDGKYLAAADLNDGHYVSVWDASTGAKVAEQKGSPDKILDLS